MTDVYSNPWKEYEDAFLKEHFFDMSDEDISKELGRSIYKIRIRARMFKLNREDTRSHGYIINKVFRDLRFAPVPDFARDMLQR